MSLTILVLALTTLGLILFDIFILIRYGKDATISWVLYSASQKYPVIAFALGVLMGHLFWGQ